MPGHLYLLARDQLPLPPRDWRKLNIQLLISDVAQTETLFTQPWPAERCRTYLSSLAAHVPPGVPWSPALGAADGTHGATDPHKATLDGYSLGGLWLPNVERFAAAARQAGAASLALDCEVYQGSKGAGGGSMTPGIAWPASPQVQAHARAFRKALAGLPLLCFVWLDDLLRTRAGASLFPGWRPWVRAVGPVQAILDEAGYVGGKNHVSPWQGIPVIGGVKLTKQVARRLPRVASFLWTPDSPASIWS